MIIHINGKRHEVNREQAACIIEQAIINGVSVSYDPELYEFQNAIQIDEKTYILIKKDAGKVIYGDLVETDLYSRIVEATPIMVAITLDSKGKKWIKLWGEKVKYNKSEKHRFKIKNI